jgi:NAD(P)-dependent dehydrogenase (short-subunit alcohol dehydrogenase family)
VILKGRVALITGASEGLGAEIAQRFSQEGAHVVFCARSQSRLDLVRTQIEKELPYGRVLAIRADVSDKNQVEMLFNEVIENFGTIDILVNNAGVYGPMGPTEDVNWDDWVETFNINLFGLVYVSRLALPVMKNRRSGKIINIGGGGAANPMPNITAYAASKAAAARFAESIALECQDFGVDVNTIAPGALNTKMMQQLLAAGPEKVGPEFYKRMKSIAEDGGAPLSIGADLCVFLASHESNGITGKIIAAQWDRWRDWPEHLKELSSSDVYTLRRVTGRDRGMAWGDV